MALNSCTTRKLQYYTVYDPSPLRNKANTLLPAPQQQADVPSDSGSLVAAAVRGAMKPTSFLSKGGAKAIGSRPMTPDRIVPSDLGGASLGTINGGAASPSPIRIVSDVAPPGAIVGGAVALTAPVSTPERRTTIGHAPAAPTSVRPQIAALDRKWKAAAGVASASSALVANPVAPFKYINERKRPADDTAVQSVRDVKRRADNWVANSGGRYSLQYPFSGMDLRASTETTSTGAPTVHTADTPMSKTYALMQSVRNAQSQRAAAAAAAAASDAHRSLMTWTAPDESTTNAPMHGDYTTPLTDAGDRPYNIWRGPSGQLEKTFGALLPTGYKLSDDPDYPFACPIRDCKVSHLFGSLKELGSHFVTHKGIDLNDNRDGTFSIVKHKPAGLAGFSPIVCSRTPLVPKAPRSTARAERQGSNGPITPSPTVESSALPAGPLPQQQQKPPLPLNIRQAATATATPPPPGTTAWQYFTLATRVEAQPMRNDFHAVANLPFNRVLPARWLTVFGHKPDIPPLAIYAALVYIAGDEAEVPCTSCQTGRYGKTASSFLGQACIVLPASVRNVLLSSKKTHACMACLMVVVHTRSKMMCSFTADVPPAAGVSSGAPSRAHVASTPTAATAATADTAATAATGWTTSASASSVGDTPVLETTSGDTTAWEDPMAAAVAPISNIPPSAGGTRLVRKSTAEARTTRELQLQDMQAKARAADQEQEEEWEMAPGQACVDWGYGPKAIAFSRSYLASADPVNIDSSLQANWVDLEPGKKHVWPARDDRTRVCTVVQGRVSITFTGAGTGTETETPAVVVGRRGDFKIPMNMACDAVNVGVGEAEIHVTTVIEPGALIWEKDSACEVDGRDF